MRPTKPITDPSFRYVDAANTDIRKTFQRVRAESARAGKQRFTRPTTLVEVPRSGRR